MIGLLYSIRPSRQSKEQSLKNKPWTQHDEYLQIYRFVLLYPRDEVDGNLDKDLYRTCADEELNETGEEMYKVEVNIILNVRDLDETDLSEELDEMGESLSERDRVEINLE